MEAIDWNRARAVPLDAVLEGFGAQRDPKDPQRNWRIGDSRITVSGERFFDHQREVGGGGAVDLTLHLLGHAVRSPRPEALREAAHWLGALDAVQTSAWSPAPQPIAAQAQRPAPTPDARNLMRVRGYLTQRRAIPQDIVDAALRRGSVFADRNGNAVFRLHSETGQAIGYELRGTGDRPFHAVHGDKGLFFNGRPASHVAAFVESGIEALSYRALHDALAISTTGNAIERPDRMARHLRERGFRIVAAFNADRDGDRYAERFAQRLGGPVDRARPQDAKDWNQLLQQLAQRPTRRPEAEAAMVR